MFRNHSLAGVLAFLCTILSAATPQPVRAADLGIAQNSAQQSVVAAPPAVQQITQAINPAQLTPMQTGVRPEATAANDLGAVADDFALDDMLLLLHRPQASEQALDEFMAEQTDPTSANYHNWLTAEQVGEYGPAQSDIETITNWLQDQGFTVNTVHADNMMIDFSGTAGQVKAAFKTQVDNLNVGGVSHVANMSVPQIPSALAPAIVGIVSIDNFKPHTNYKLKPDYSPGGTVNSYPANLVTPQDLAVIYNFNPLFNATPTKINGNGQTIALIEDEDPYTTNDFVTFRSTFGLPAFASLTGSGYPSYAAVHPSCTDPGDSDDGTDGEIALDVEYAGASAPYAALHMVSCGDTATTFGGLIAMQNLNTANDSAMVWSVSYGECEAENGASRNAAFSSTYQTAAARGVSVFVSSGDEGAASCDADQTKAVAGIAVSGFTSTPYNVSVGGTDFGDAYAGTSTTYWGSDSSTYESAKSYINEIPWNDSCASALISTKEGSPTPYGSSGFCNSTTGKASYLTTGSGSGGPSGCATGTATTTVRGADGSTEDVVSGTCAGTAKPSWQSGIVGNPSDGVRDIPDVSLFAANGVWGHYYVFCYSDPGANLGGAACTGAPSGWSGAGGTSFASPIMAGIQALINQNAGIAQGNPNPTYYSIAETEYGASGSSACKSTLGSGVSSSCIFYDVTQGDMDVNCTGTHNCYIPSGTNGVLSTVSGSYSPAYGTTTAGFSGGSSVGWDFATGIGSVNACNLVNDWPGTAGSIACGGTKPTLYTIGGSVTSLTTSGLVLSLAAGTSTTVVSTQTVSVASGANSYAFATGEQNDTTYTVSIQTQPTGQTCALANPTGVVGTANVTNVNVTCTPITYTLTYTAGSNGTISGTTPQTVNSGANGTAVTAVPNAGYHFVQWSDASTANPRTDTNVTANISVTASFAINTYTLTYTAGANGSITGTTPQTVNSGGNGTAVTAVPNAGYHFVQWSDASTANPRTDTNVTANISVTASFAITTYTLTYTAGANGTISGTTPQTVNSGANGTAVTAVPNAGYHFVQWSDASTANPRTDTNVTANISVTASFAINTYTLTYTAGANGTISGTTPQTVNSGANGTAVTAVPNAGYHFVQWSDASTANPRTDTNVTANISVTASFAINTYTLTYTAGANGSITGTTPQTVNSGGNGTAVTAVPNAGYHFVQWSDASTANPRTDTNVTANISVTASFAITTYTLTYTAGANGTISGTTPQTVNSGANGTAVTAVPNAGYHFVQWSDASTANPRTDTNVTANISVTASFAINTYTLTYTAGANGSITGTTPQTVNSGGNGTAVTAVPNAGYHFVQWSDASTANPRTDTNVTANISVTASFAITTYTLTYTAGANGTISGTTPQTVNSGGSGTAVTAVPNAGYHFVQWSDASTANPRTDTNVTANISVTASFAITTYTLTYTAGANGTISGTTPQTVNSGANGTAVTAVPNAGYHFVQWSDASTANPRTDTNVTANISVTASFAINTYTLTYTAGANGSITGTTPQTVNSGGNGTAVTAVPNAGYHFVQWSDASTANPRTDTNVTANISVTASFAINTYTLTYTAGANGSITGTTPQTVNSGGNGTAVTAVPNAGYHFVQWSDASTANPRTDTNVTANISVTASFAITTYTLTYTAGANGTISGTTPQTVNSGGNGTAVTAVPNAGYHFVQWSDASTANPRTDTNVTANISVTASFAITTYTLTYTAGANGTISGTTPQTVNSGANGTAVTAVPNAGYHFVQWSDASTANPRTDTNVTANISVTASFAINTYTLTYTAGANGSITGTTPQTVNSGGNGTAVTAVPNAGYHFVQWSDASTANPRTDTNVTANISVTASFAITTYTLTYTAGANGTISGTTPQTVNSGANGTAVTAVPNAGYHFVQWSDASTANPRTDTNVTANISVTASFAINTYTLTYTAGANGSITGTTPQTVNSGGNGTAVTAVPSAGYHFVQWSDASTANPRTDTNVTANISVTASFAINTYTLTYTAGANGTISGTTPQTVNSGGNGTAVTAVPNAGYHFVQWSDASTANPRTDTNVTANISVTASFAQNQLVFTTQPADVTRGDALGIVVVTEQDGSGNTIIDNSSSVDFTVSACGGSIDLGSVTMIGGVATLNSTQRFYTLTSTPGLQINASTGTLNGTSQAFNVVASSEFVFANGFEACRL